MAEDLFDVWLRQAEPGDVSEIVQLGTLALPEMRAPRARVWLPPPRYARRRSLRDAVRRTVARGRA